MRQPASSEGPGAPTSTCREGLLAAAFGAVATLPVALVIYLLGSAWIPAPSHPRLAAAMALAWAGTSIYLVGCFAAYRRIVEHPSADGLVYGAAFACANFLIDALVLLAAFRHPAWFAFLRIEQVQSIALFLPLAYLAMIAIPLAYERMRVSGRGSRRG